MLIEPNQDFGIARSKNGSQMDFNKFLKDWAMATMMSYASPKLVTVCCGTGDWISEEDVGYMCLTCGNRSSKREHILKANPANEEEE